MRKYINIITEWDSTNQDDADQAMMVISQYILHNASGDNLIDAMSVLREHGYEETMGGGRYYRALIHDITDADRLKYETITDLYNDVGRGHFDISRSEPQGFTTSWTKAARFIGSMFDVTANRGEVAWHEDQSLAIPARFYSLIYECLIPDGAIIFSMDALRTFASTAAPGRGRDELINALDENNGYGKDDEVLVDMRATITVTEHRLFNDDFEY